MWLKIPRPSFLIDVNTNSKMRLNKAVYIRALNHSLHSICDFRLNVIV